MPRRAIASLFVLLCAVSAQRVHDCVSPSVELTADSVVPGEELSVTLAQLPASTKYVVRVAKKGLSPLVSASGQSDANGAGTQTVTIPSNAPLGNYSVGVAAVCGTTPVHNAAPLVIGTCPSPSLAVSASVAHPSDTIMVHLRNYLPSALVIVRVMRTGLSPLLTFKDTTDSEGSFLLSITLPPNAPAANYTVGGIQQCGSQFIQAAQPLQIAKSTVNSKDSCPTPSVSLSASSVAAGGTLIANLQGFLPSAQVIVRVMRTGLSPLVTLRVNTDAQGSSLVTISIPAKAPAANYTVGGIQKCQSSFIQASQPLAITTSLEVDAPATCPSPTISISASTVKPGGTIIAHLDNFVPSTAVIVRVMRTGLSPLVTIKTTTNAQGAIMVTIAIPANAPAANYTVGGIQQCDSQYIQASLPLVISNSLADNEEEDEDACPSPAVSVSSSSVTAGQAITAVVTSLVPSSTATIMVSKTGLSPLIILKREADAGGSIPLQLTIPATAKTGDYLVSVSAPCETTHITASTSIHVTAAPSAPQLPASCPAPFMSLSSAVVHSGGNVTATITNLVPSTAFLLRVSRPAISPMITMSGQSDSAGKSSLVLKVPANAVAATYTAGVIQTCGSSFIAASAPLQVVVAAADLSVAAEY